jgi:hypothetical protein
MEESKLCEICKKKLANVSLWKKDRMVRMGDFLTCFLAFPIFSDRYTMKIVI